MKDIIKAAIIAELERQSKSHAIGPYIRDDANGWYTIDGMVNLDKIADAIMEGIGKAT